jgi:hypothetical protein
VSISGPDVEQFRGEVASTEVVYGWPEVGRVVT